LEVGISILDLPIRNARPENASMFYAIQSKKTMGRQPIAKDKQIVTMLGKGCFNSLGQVQPPVNFEYRLPTFVMAAADCKG
jgi:hypothetical protein